MIKSKDEADVAARVIDRTTESAQVSIRYSTINPAASEPGVERDRRAKPRYGVSLSVTLFGDHNFYIGLSENLSEGGLFVQTQPTLHRYDNPDRVHSPRVERRILRRRRGALDSVGERGPRRLQQLWLGGRRGVQTGLGYSVQGADARNGRGNHEVHPPKGS